MKSTGRGRRAASAQRRKRGASPVQAALVVCLVGCVLAAFLPTFLRELRLSKVSEAAEHLASMHARAAAYYAQVDPETGRTRCLPEPAGPTPAEPSVEPIELDWADASTPSGATWVALGFAPERPVRFSYSFEPVASGCDLRSPEGTFLVTYRASGDLDGDGERSLFERRAAASESGAELAPIGVLYVRDRVE